MVSSLEVKGWKDFLISGIIMVIIGVLMVIFKASSLNIILIVFGILLIIAGVIEAAIGVKSGTNDIIAISVVKIVIGVLMVVLTMIVRDVLMVILAIGLIVIGATNILSAIKVGVDLSGRIIPLVVGVAFLGLGIFAIMNLHSTADIAMIVIGVVTIVCGAFNLFDAYKLKTA